jgi:hypothetical protein
MDWRRSRRLPLPKASALRSWWAGIGIQNQIAIVIPLTVAVIGAAVAIGLSVLDRSDPQGKPVAPRGKPDNSAMSGQVSKGAWIVVDGLSVEDTGTGAQVVDLQVRNSGARVAYIHAVKFKILAIGEVPFCPLASPVRSSYTYEVAFPEASRTPPVVIEKRVDQAIEGDDVDRFRILLGNPEGGLESTLYQSTIELIYNQGLSTDPEPVVIQLQGFWEPEAYTITGDSEYRQCLRELVENTLAITRMPGERSSSVRQLLAEARRLDRELEEGGT